VAAHLKNTLGVDAELVRGGSGELSVWVDDVRVISKAAQIFPTPEECEAAVRQELAKRS
jgi:hypothetical protein